MYQPLYIQYLSLFLNKCLSIFFYEQEAVGEVTSLATSRAVGSKGSDSAKRRKLANKPEEDEPSATDDDESTSSAV